MVVFGLTGNIGSGKSTVAKILTEYGFYHIDADQIGRLVVEPGTPANLQLQKVFGKDFFDENNNLLRKKLGARVFADADALQKLNDITHPAINAEIIRQIAEVKEQNPEQNIILEAAVLFEAGMEALADSVVLVFADDDIRLQRVTARDGLTEEKVKDRMNSQMPQTKKRELSQYVIYNNGSLADLRQNVAEFAENLHNSASE